MSATKERNHYVPRFLLNRFASRADGKKRFVWQFSKDRSPKELSTKDVGVSSFFYGKPENGVEERLQGVEETQARALVAVDQGQSPAEHAATLRQLIWMLTVRTNATRQQFAATGSTMMDQLERTAGSDEAKAAMLAQAHRECDDLLRKDLAKLPTPYATRALELLENPARVDAFRDLLTRHVGTLDLQGFLRWARQQAGQLFDFTNVAAKGQIRGLSALLDLADAPASFAPSHWEVIRRPKGTFLLGDGCVFAISMEGRISSPFVFKDTWQAVYCPISSSAVLVASPRPIDGVLSDERINVASVELSDAVFFASQCTDRESEYAARIGTGEPLISEVELAEMARNGWKDLRDGKGRSKQAPGDGAKSEIKPPPNGE
ncbi:MAG: DUF4238 domain-containing protein [Phycisphaeraceae bacterium]|nr:DUF4238 domain-containing protein [Phycisphaeraceae bacterium]